ncbi:Ribosomal protein L6, alpha-beta domain [Pseudocohnilembus persalinus]|uniref:Ribosomal protein L6, alpha-beta domain n=1 Tax=Pseudocohnilembus persalinus TaxID=266149 RepID=A0A0V0QTV5_PSEPJ|nr:Ribosomal protein L6, alpha-beta domain [Pseudocohnilembus persalinus]|eukprot:KRX05597.1 Ribosomal protein L6, alpha-beta domain [Pseudocohnilembus persalinus]
MKYVLTEGKVDVPAKVSVKVNSRNVEVTGPLGTVKKTFKHVSCDIFKQKAKKGDQVKIQMWLANRKQKASVNSVTSEIENMITGVTKGYKYKMRYAFAHFPIQALVTDGGNAVEIKNFLGEKIIRRIEMLPGVKVSRNDAEKDALTLEGVDITNVSLTCARINQSCLVKNKDIRMFLDGCYVSEKRLAMVEDDE